jgi:peptidoglycan L-alanyl-D-glutamate endopeptidase CwlK
MPVFSAQSKKHLATCHPDLQLLFNTVIETHDCTILEGYRDEEAQNKAFAQRKSRLKYPNGKHNKKPSMAVDVISFPVDFNNLRLCIWFGGYVQGVAERLRQEGKISHTIRWGGAWDGVGILNRPGMLQDLVHFEILS